MAFWEVWMLGIGLSMDAFAVALCKGLSMKQWSLKSSLVIAGFFGAFQALMPFLGWLLGSSFRQYIESVDHWVAFGLLLHFRSDIRSAFSFFREACIHIKKCNKGCCTFNATALEKMDHRGIEPLTSRLRTWRSPS